MAGKFIDLTGQKFNRLSVVKYIGKNNLGQSVWECLCDCGNKKITAGSSLKRSLVKSCGCLRAEKSRITAGQNRAVKHGRTGTAEYVAWQAMKKRCYWKGDPYYYCYGAIGIIVCERWVNSFENFFEDMGPRPSSKHSVDRFPNKKGNYEPSNCRWATNKEQANNKTDNRILEYKGERMTVAQWSDRIHVELGINRHTIYSRLTKYKWSVEKTLTSKRYAGRNTIGANKY
jgi:hypothetical protein